MAKSAKWEACLQQEIKPALPLHDPTKGWIPAEYLDGTQVKVDLTTLLKDLHLIKDVDLGHTAATAALYRVVISILYAAIDFKELEVEDEDSWTDVKLELMQTNEGRGEGLDPDWVDDYFAKFSDRFYLLHPTTPFLQDPSLFKTIGLPEVAEDNAQKVRTELSKVTAIKSQSVRALHPHGISPANGESDRIPTWGVPRENFLEPTDPEDVITSNLMTMLFYLRYSHPALGAKPRYYWGQETEAARKSNDTYPAAHAFRCALNYVVSFRSLYQTLVFAMEYFEPSDLENDLPEWERPVDPETGYLAGVGYDRRSADIASVTLPRSSVNLTHQGLAIVPQYDPETGSMANKGGLVYTLRTALFNFKNEKAFVTKKAKKGEEPVMEEVKKPSPVTWNPFVVRKVAEDKVLKATSAISPDAYVSSTTIPRILTAYEMVDFIKPKPLQDMEEETTNQELSSLNPYVKIMIFSGDPAKQKDFVDFTVNAKETGRLAHNKMMSERVDEWLEAGKLMAFAVSGNVEQAHVSGKNEKIAAEPNHEFWVFYSQLFDRALTSESITPVARHRDEILRRASQIYAEATESISTVRPMKVAQHQGYMRGRIYKILGETTQDAPEEKVIPDKPAE